MYLVRNAGRTLPLGVEEVHEPGLEGGELPVQLRGNLDEQVVFPLQQRRASVFYQAADEDNVYRVTGE
jgi:hypothetical protein